MISKASFFSLFTLTILYFPFYFFLLSEYELVYVISLAFLISTVPLPFIRILLSSLVPVTTEPVMFTLSVNSIPTVLADKLEATDFISALVSFVYSWEF